jgi:hypothetical protein
MSQIVTCPCGCNHTFEVDELFEKYEKIAAGLVNGKLCPRGTVGYDLIEQDGTTYQVKHSNARMMKHGKHAIWGWDFRLNHISPDFCILFGVTQNEYFVFLVPYEKAKSMASYRNPNSYDGPQLRLNAGSHYGSWIWDYRVSPENFMRRVAELKAAQQLSMMFSTGLGDV